MDFASRVIYIQKLHQRVSGSNEERGIGMDGLRTAVRRRELTRWLAISPFAVCAGTASAQDQVWSYDTSPVFGELGRTSLRPVTPSARGFSLAEVHLLNGALLDAQRANVAYMKRIDIDRLLHTFRLNAGLPSDAKPLGGWEAPEIELRGHFAGHYLSACALGYASTGDTELKRRGDAIVEELAICQRALDAGGYLSAFPTELFDRLASGKWVWAPFYTLHKIMAGLLDMHDLAGNRAALQVLLGMATWTDTWTAARDEAAMLRVINQEFGGMNDILYRLAAVTQDARWIAVGDRFTKKSVFEPLFHRKDTLRGLHMNEHVAQILGAASRFDTTGDVRFRQVADFFWDTVVEGRTYATGGSSNKEHWIVDSNRLGFEAMKGDNHQECCCAYNMMKLTAQRFAWRPDVALIDYYERNLLNHRLGMIDPKTGMTGYFLSLTPGAWKTRGTEDTTFWCCNGTALEEFNKLTSMVYAQDDDGIFVNLFVPTRLETKSGIRLRQETSFPAQSRTRLVVEAGNRREWTLRLRIPGWASKDPRVLINGKPAGTPEPGSYLAMRRRWKRGDVVDLELPMRMTLERFNDRPGVGALVYGPVVLAQQLAMGSMPPALLTTQGPEMAKVSPVAVTALPADIADRLRPEPASPLTFTADVNGRNLLFKPISDSWERYAVYAPVA
ncbi:beta-L-arabinofuranosidase domain-containing protein [Sphingomonas sp. UNC305MFCol5.2]|uniref:beta-L-arabinofuranosidase domain-containing protein n=1 Tax=Sphingomonas sp. UNC305MFCol5.2 TaxID=1449076 RepID=UPI0003F57BBE|nr:beta-L-arabinofuranosidase domain-containing protein [Sphingomonas sp. UNC305MFCol5.2]